MDAVRAADLQRLAVLLGARRDDGEGAVEAREDQRARLADLQRERRVDDVGGGEAVVEPAALLAELLGDGVDEGGGVVVERRLELGDPLRRSAVSPAAMRAAASSGTTPSSAQAAVAASSTSSHVASFPSSDQILAMAGRE